MGHGYLTATYFIYLNCEIATDHIDTKVSLVSVFNMKVLLGLVYSNLVALQAYAAASSKAYGYTFDPKFQSYQDASLITPITVRLLLAQRLGISQYHSLNGPSEDTLEILNKFGGDEGQILLPGDQRTNSEKLLIFVENVEHPEGVF